MTVLPLDSAIPRPQVFSTPEFRAAVHALAPRIAVFDCDGTLWSGDAGSSFMAWTIDQGLLAPERVRWLGERYELYKRGTVSEAAICGEMVQVYAGISINDMRQAAATFFREQIEPNIFPELRELIAALQHAGTEIWAVSSTNDWVIEEGMQRFGIPPERVLSARVAEVAGLVSEELLDVPTDEGKVLALRRVGVTAPDAVFGNSIHDAAMLAVARQAFPVNPTAGLAERCVAEGWTIYWPASVARGA